MSSRPPRGIDSGQSQALPTRPRFQRCGAQPRPGRPPFNRCGTLAIRTPAGRPLLHIHAWTDNVPERLLGQARKPAADADTMVHQFLRELG
jgi:hypothetical protein